MLNFIIGVKGSGKTTKAHRILGEAVKNGNKAMLIVPKQFTFQSDKGILHLLGPKDACEVEVFSFSRLATVVMQTYGGITSPVAKQGVRNILMSLAIESLTEKIKIFARHKNELSLVSKMLDTIDELKKQGISLDAFEKSIGAVQDRILQEKMRETALILRAYEAVAAQNYFDDADLLSFVADTLRGKDFFAGKVIVLDGFADFTAPEIDIILTMLRTAKEVYITLCSDDITKKDGLSPFALCNATARKLRLCAGNNFVDVGCVIVCERDESFYSADLMHLEKELFNMVYESFDGESENLSVTCCSAILSECDYVARKIKKLLRSGKYRCRDIAICFRNGADYEGHLRQALKKYDVPLFEDKRQAVENQPLISFVSTLLSIASKGLSSDLIFRLLKTGLTELTAEEISETENYCFMWDISGKKWTCEWLENPDGLGERMTPERQERLARLNKSREKICLALTSLKEALDGRSGKEAVRVLYSYLRENKVDQRLKLYAIDLEERGLTELALEQEQVWDILMEVFDEIASAIGDSVVDMQRLSELFSLVINTKSLGKLPDGFDEVLIASADRMLTVNAPVVFVMGLNAGVFPGGLSEKGLFSLKEKDRLRMTGLDFGESVENAVVRERFLLYNALASAKNELHLSYCLTGASGEKLNRSDGIEPIFRIFPGKAVCYDRDENLIDLIESEASAFELMAKKWEDKDTFSETLKTYFSEKDAYKDKIRAIEKAVSYEDDNFENKEISTALFGKHMKLSASRIEDYGKCPFLYFCRYGLQAKAREKAKLDASHSGTVIHHVLEMLLKKYKGKAFLELTDEQIKAEIAAILSDYMKDNMGSEESKTERFNYLYYRSEKILEYIMLRLRAEFNDSDFAPCDFELRIGEDGDIEPMKYTLENGSIQLNGFVDRVDCLDSNGKRYIRIVDYKSGAKEFRLNEVFAGLNMQMLLYLVSIWRNGKDFYENIVPAGVLYFPAKISPCDTERNSSDEERLRARIAMGKMNGLLVDVDDVIIRMEKELENQLKGVFIPADIDKKTGELKGSFISVKQLEKLAGKMDDIICDMGNNLHNGIIAARPVEGSSYTDICSWCDYSDICKDFHYKRWIEKNDHAECLRRLDGGEDNEEKLD